MWRCTRLAAFGGLALTAPSAMGCSALDPAPSALVAAIPVAEAVAQPIDDGVPPAIPTALAPTPTVSATPTVCATPAINPWGEAFNLSGDLRSFPRTRLGGVSDVPAAQGEIVFRRSGQLWKVELPSKAMTQLTHGPGVYAYPTWDPSGRHLAFVTNRDRAIFRVEVRDAAAREVLWRGPALPGEGICKVPPMFSPDGSSLLYGACSGKDVAGGAHGSEGAMPVDLRVVKLNASPIVESRRLADVEGHERRAWSANGMRSAVARWNPEGPPQNGEITLLDARGQPRGTVGTAYPTPFYAFSTPSFAPDGRHLAATVTVCTQPECSPPIRGVVVVDTEDPRHVAFVEYGSSPAWRPAHEGP